MAAKFLILKKISISHLSTAKFNSFVDPENLSENFEKCKSLSVLRNEEYKNGDLWPVFPFFEVFEHTLSILADIKLFIAENMYFNSTAGCQNYCTIVKSL